LILSARERRRLARAANRLGVDTAGALVTPAPRPVRVESKSDLPAVDVVGGDIERALRLLRRRVDRAGVLRELRRREHHMTPGEARRAKTIRARRREAKYAARWGPDQ
jgi:small subunit ribosomal protein S21